MSLGLKKLSDDKYHDLSTHRMIFEDRRLAKRLLISLMNSISIINSQDYKIGVTRLYIKATLGKTVGAKFTAKTIRRTSA